MGKVHASSRFGLKGLVCAGSVLGALGASAAITVVDESFNAGNAGYSVTNTGSLVDDWQYNAGAGQWAVIGACCLGAASSSALTSPAYTLPSSGEVLLRVSHRYHFEYDGASGKDGGQLRFSVNGGPFQAVSSFSQNGYDRVIQGINALTGQMGFNGPSSGYSTATFHDSVASLGTLNAGDTVSIRLIGAWDAWNRAGYPSWVLDRIQLTQEAAAPGGEVVSSATSDVFMASATTLAGNGGSGPRINYFSIRTRKPAVHSGTVSVRVAGSIIDNQAGWADDAFNGANGRHYIEFENGSTADIQDTFAGTKSLSVPGTLPASVVVGMRYAIRPHTTLGDIFGYNNEAELQPGQNPSQADNVLFYAGDAQQTITYFYSSVPGYPGWYRSDYSPAGDAVLYPEQGVIVRRRSAGDLQLVDAGQPLSRPLVVPVYMGFNILGTLQANSSVTLDDLNMVTGNAATGLAPGVNAAEADNLVVIRADATASTYFYSNYAGFEGWYSSSYAPSGQVTIPPGSVFFVQRKSPRAMFEWTVPMAATP